MDNVKSGAAGLCQSGPHAELSEPQIWPASSLPSAMPAIWDSMRISLGWAWTWLVVAELVAATSGLGYRITTAQRFFQTDTIFGYLLLLGVLGLATDQAMKWASRKLFRYSICSDDRTKAQHLRVGKDVSRRPRRRGGAERRRSDAGRTNSFPWSAPRAAASRPAVDRRRAKATIEAPSPWTAKPLLAPGQDRGVVFRASPCCPG